MRRFDHKQTDLDLLQILVAINLQASALKELHLVEWDFSQDAVVNVVNTYLNDLCWFSVNLMTLRVNRATFEAFAWKLKSNASVSHVVVEERSALEDICTLSLFCIVDQDCPPEFIPEWVARVQALEGPEGATLRKRLNCKVIRKSSGYECDVEGIVPVQQSLEYSLPIVRMVTTGIRAGPQGQSH